MDNIRQKLNENYEDALFAILMDDYAQSEGQRLLEDNKRLQNDENNVVPAGMEARGIKVINKAFRKMHLKSISKISTKIISRVAVIVLVCNIVFGVSFFSVEAFRVEVLNMALKYQETHTTVRFVDEGAPSGTPDVLTIEDLQAILPESYVLESYEETPDGGYAMLVASDGTWITWDIYSITATLNLDTENADVVQEIQIDGYSGILIEKNGISTVSWGDTSANKLYCVSANMEYKALVKIMDDLTS